MAMNSREPQKHVLEIKLKGNVWIQQVTVMYRQCISQI